MRLIPSYTAMCLFIIMSVAACDFNEALPTPLVTATTEPSVIQVAHNYACGVDCSLKIRRLEGCALETLVDKLGPPEKFYIDPINLNDSEPKQENYTLAFLYPNKGLNYYALSPDFVPPRQDMKASAYHCYEATTVDDYMASDTRVFYLDWEGFGKLPFP